MRWAELILNYLRALIWPAVIIVALWIFRDQLRTLILSAKRISAFGAEAEFKELEGGVEIAQRKLNELKDSVVNSEQSPTLEESSEIETVKDLSSVDFSDLDTMELGAAGVEAGRRLDYAIGRVLKYFGVPPILDPQQAGEAMMEISGDERWIDLLRITSRTREIAAGLSDSLDRARKGGNAEQIARVESGIREATSLFYQSANVLPILAETALENRNVGVQD